MSSFNLIPWGRWGTGVKSYFGFQGENPIPTLNPELQTSVVLENDRAEMAYVRQERICQISAIQAGGAQVAQQQLINPAGSGVLVTLEICLVEINTTGNVNAAIDPTPITMATVNGNGPRDTRWRNVATFRAGAGIAQAQNAAQIGGGANQVFMANTWNLVAGVSEHFILKELVLGPGSSYIVWNSTAATNLGVTWCWRERQLLPTEA